MSKMNYNSEQILEITSNKYVSNCTSKSIIFENTFKDKALELSKSGVDPKSIFEKYGFPGFVSDSRIPEQSLKNWRNIAKNTGLPYKNRVKKDKRKAFDPTNMTLEEENEYLRAELAYLKEVQKLIALGFP